MQSPSGNYNMHTIKFPVTEIGGNKFSKPDVTRKDKSSFNDYLKTAVEKGNEVKFSGHAAERIAFRGISVGSEEVTKLNEAVKRAEEKGARESLVLMNDLAFIVNVKNKTVVTAVDGNSMKDKVFTNIDSTIIL